MSDVCVRQGDVTVEIDTGPQRGEGEYYLCGGTWLIDHVAPRIGVISKVYVTEEFWETRLSIRWFPNQYENTSLSWALSRFKSGEWEVYEK